MGDESAYAWMDEAIRGEHVPADQRDAYNPVTIYGRGSSNICVLNAANDAWYAFHHEPNRLGGIIDAWHRYFNCKGAYYHGQSEPYGCFRYAQWQTMSLVAMHGLAQRIGDAVLEDLCARWIRYRIFAFGLTACWWKFDEAGQGGTVAGPNQGVRSWVGPKVEGGGVPRPYQGIAESGGIGHDYSNVRGARREANWEVEPILRALQQSMGYQRWNCITSDEVQLLKRVANVKAEMTQPQRADMQRLCGLLEDTKFVIHVSINFFRTDQGAAVIFMQSWSSGSTNMKFGGLVLQGGRDGSEMRETWANEIHPQYKWCAESPYNRKSDPGGFGSFAVFQNRVELYCTTRAGAAANGFEPGAGHYYAQWKGQSQDPAAWPEGKRKMTLPGKLVAHYEIKKKQSKVLIHYPPVDGDPGPDPDPDPGDPFMSVAGTKFSMRVIARAQQLLDKHGGNVNKAKKEADTDPEYQDAFGGWLRKWKQEAGDG